MKDNIQPRSGMTSQVVLGFLVIAMGLLFLLDNLGILDMHRAFSFWPTLFIVVGTVKLCDTATPGGRLVGAVLLGIGLLLTLDRMDIIEFSWRAVWPLALIGLGALMLVKAARGRRMVAGGGASLPLTCTGTSPSANCSRRCPASFALPAVVTIAPPPSRTIA